METLDLSSFLPKESFCPLRNLFPLISQLSYPVLLESSYFNSQVGRYSILTAEPYLIFKEEEEKITIESKEKKETLKGNPFKILKEIWPTIAPLSIEKTELPFIGGAIGYFSYDLKDYIEELPSLAEKDLKLPLIYLCFYGWAVVADHLREKVFLVTTEKSPLSSKEIIQILKKPIKFSPRKIPRGRSKSFKSNFSKEKYLRAVKEAINYIYAGDVFQVNLSQRFETKFTGDPFLIYSYLQQTSPSPFAAFLNFPELSLLSCSPERFLLLTPEGSVETRPIKGTRPRSKNPFLDKKLAIDLIESEKERAENLMIVDLERNDLGKIARTGTVKVEKLFKIESYATVHHLVSIIKAQLREELDKFNLLEATFPGGSITGAPKVRAMEIIEELEPTKRGPYTGALGYLSFNGQMDLNIIIRTILIQNNQAFFQVGGGIVADSQPDLEYEETLHKGKAFFKVLKS